MKYNYLKEKETLAFGIKLAADRVKSNNITDVLVEWVKMAQDMNLSLLKLTRVEEALTDKFRRDGLSKDAINYVLDDMNDKSPVKSLEKLKKNPIYQSYVKVLTQSREEIQDYLNSLGNSPEMRDLISEMFNEDSKTNFNLYALRPLFEKGEVNLAHTINGIISVIKGNIAKKNQGGKTVTIDTGLSETLGTPKPVEDPTEYLKLLGIEGDDHLAKMKLFDIMEQQMSQDYDGGYIKKIFDGYRTRLDKAISNIEMESDPRISVQYEANFDKLFRQIFAALYKKAKNMDRLYEHYNKMRIDETSLDDIIESTTGKHHKILMNLPKWLRDFNEGHPEFVRLLVKTGLETLFYTNLAKALDISLANTVGRKKKDAEGNTTEEDSRGNGRMSLGDIWRGSLIEAIDATIKDPEKNQKLKTLLEEFFRQDINESGKPKQITSRLESQLAHLPGLLHSGWLSGILKRYPNGLTPEQETQLIQQLREKYYPQFEDSDYVHPVLPLHQLEKGSKTTVEKKPFNFENHTRDQVWPVVEQTIRDRMQNARDIQTGYRFPGQLLIPRLEDNEPKLSRNMAFIFRRG